MGMSLREANELWANKGDRLWYMDEKLKIAFKTITAVEQRKEFNQKYREFKKMIMDTIGGYTNNHLLTFTRSIRGYPRNVVMKVAGELESQGYKTNIGRREITFQLNRARFSP